MGLKLTGRKQKAIFSSALIISSMFFQIACKTEAQKAIELFADGKMPASLFRAANQIHEIRDLDKIIARVQADQKNPNLLKVAVIDNGIDIAHPDLSGRIAFDVENGRIVGAGLDLMGDDRFASHNLIRGDFYAFGAQGLRNGKIVGPSNNPLTLLASMNDQFMKELVAKIQADPELKKSLFAKINAESFSIFGAHYLLTYDLMRFNQESYERQKKNGTLTTAAKKSSDLKDKDGNEIGITQRKQTHYTVERPWKLSAENGLAMAGDGDISLNSIEGADRFFKIMTETFDTVKASSGYEKAYTNYLEFIRPRQFEPGDDEGDVKKKAIENLAAAYHFKRYGPSSKDPLRALIAFVDALVVERKLLKGEVIDGKYKPTYDDIKAAFDEALARTEKMIRTIHQSKNKTAEQARMASELTSKLGAFRELSAWALKERVWERASLSDFTAQLPQNSLYRRHLVRTGHPFFADGSAESLHGSHVAGIIAVQDENIRIVPVRVTTESTQAAPDALKAEKQSFKKRFVQWLADPVVFRAVGGKFGGFIEGVNFSDESPANRKRAAVTILKVLDSKIEMAFDADWTNFTFVEEIKKAVRYVGERQVKIANVSLGMNFGKKVANSTDISNARKLESVFEFLQFEFFKYEIAVETERSARNTLFVIAAGNEGNWVDGRSRTALPVDLSSPFLEEFENAKKGEIAPNNRVKNILGVGSIGPGHELSSFTNIILSSKTPFIMAEGENILSPVKSTSKDAHNQMFQRYLPETEHIMSLQLMALQDERLKEVYRAEMSEEDKANPEKAYRRELEISMRYRASVEAFSAAMDAANLHMFLRYPQNRARLSGTSMATPTVVGLLSKMMIEKAQRMGIPAGDLYNHPEFSPEKMIEEALAKGKPLAGNLRGISLKMLIGDKKWDLAPKAQEAEKLMMEFVSRGAKDNRLGPMDFDFAARSKEERLSQKRTTVKPAVTVRIDGVGGTCQTIF